MSLIRYNDQAKTITYPSDKFACVNTEGGTTYAYSRVLSGNGLDGVPETQEQQSISFKYDTFHFSRQEEYTGWPN